MHGHGQMVIGPSENFKEMKSGEYTFIKTKRCLKTVNIELTEPSKRVVYTNLDEIT